MKNNDQFKKDIQKLKQQYWYKPKLKSRFDTYLLLSQTKPKTARKRLQNYIEKQVAGDIRIGKDIEDMFIYLEQILPVILIEGPSFELAKNELEELINENGNIGFEKKELIYMRKKIHKFYTKFIVPSFN